VQEKEMAQSKIKKNNRISQIATWTLTVILGIVILGVLFLKFTPGYGLYFVRSGSMSPVFNAGDIVITGPVNEIEIGEIITFVNDTKVITHRVTGIEGDQILTKGDANEDADTFLTPVSQVQGSYLFRIPGLGYLQTFLHTKMGWFLVVILPTFLLVIWIVVEIFREVLKSPSPKMAAAQAAAGSLTTASLKKAQPEDTRLNSKLNIKQSTLMTSTGLPSEEVVVTIRKQLSENFKDIYQNNEFNK
jgi:signal peptidase I